MIPERHPIESDEGGEAEAVVNRVALGREVTVGAIPRRFTPG